MSDETSTPSSKPTGSSILDDTHVMLVVNSRVDERFRERNESFRKWFAIILSAVLVIFTVGGVFTLKFYVENIAESAVEKVEDEIRFNSEVAALNFRVLRLDTSSTFTSDEAKSIIEEIRSIVSKKGDNRLDKLTFIIDTSVKRFAEADLLDFVLQLENIEDIDPNLFLNSNIVIQTMLQVLGITLLADARAPDSWTDKTGSRSKIYKKYQTYADRAKYAGHRELYLLYEMLFSYMEERPKQEIRNLIEDTNDLSKVDTKQFIKVMTSLASRGGMINPTAESKRIVRQVTKFLCEYKDKGDLLREVTQKAALQC